MWSKHCACNNQKARNQLPKEVSHNMIRNPIATFGKYYCKGNIEWLLSELESNLKELHMYSKLKTRKWKRTCKGS